MYLKLSDGDGGH